MSPFLCCYSCADVFHGVFLTVQMGLIKNHLGRGQHQPVHSNKKKKKEEGLRMSRYTASRFILSIGVLM